MFRKIAAIVGWKETSLIYLRWPEIRDWFLRIWFCHHNARVLADMEYRMSCVLSAATGCMSKPYYTWPAMEREIYAYQTQIGEDAVKDYKNDYNCTCDRDADE